tara:strand:- start:117 stop:662 length:546 start_codon:yes stop_codon:yes gene_type:complete
MKKFSGKMPKEIENKCYIPKAIIPLSQDDIILMTNGMENYMYAEIEGNGVCQIRQRLCDELNAITLMPRNSVTIESVGYVLRCHSELLWSEFHEINSKFDELCKNGNMHFNYGVAEEKECNKEISLSIFYFTGQKKQAINDNASFDVDEDTIADVSLALSNDKRSDTQPPFIGGFLISETG